LASTWIRAGSQPGLAEIIDWPDFGLPPDGARAAAQIRGAFSRAKGGEGVEIGCLGGLGRTGTVLACMAVLGGVEPLDAVAWVRENYRSGAIETPEQESWVDWFAESGR
jgi:protein-tyrosine phosphatase